MSHSRIHVLLTFAAAALIGATAQAQTPPAPEAHGMPHMPAPMHGMMAEHGGPAGHHGMAAMHHLLRELHLTKEQDALLQKAESAMAEARIAARHAHMRAMEDAKRDLANDQVKLSDIVLRLHGPQPEDAARAATVRQAWATFIDSLDARQSAMARKHLAMLLDHGSLHGGMHGGMHGGPGDDAAPATGHAH
jgi:hypothetical protein